MATSGKKGKKNKGKVISLQNFLSNGDTPPGVTQVAKKVRNRGEESDDDDAPPQVYQLQLPTAPRASRMFDDDSVPHKPPFLAYITNVPFDVQEEDIYDFFEGTNILALRLPREDGENGRLRGFGYIEFETREDLIFAIRLPDPHIRNRRIRIDVSSESEQQQRERRGNRSRYDGFGSSENRDSTNWRRGNDEGGRENDRGERRSGYGYNRDRPRDGSLETGSWRTADRPNLDSSPGRRSGGGFGDRFGGGRRGGYEENRKSDDVLLERPKLNLKPRTLPLPEIVTQVEDKAGTEEDEERVPTPGPEPPKSKPTGVAAEKVFGGAKPVDTAAREKEIEERLEREQQEELLTFEEEDREGREREEKEREADTDEKETEHQTEKDEKENRNTISWRRRDDEYKSDDNKKYSPDRRAAPPQRRNDERRGNRDSRDSGRDRRDFNRGFDRDNRMRDNRDRNERPDRDYNRDNRDRGYNKDNNKTYPRDNKQQRDDKPKRDIRPEKPMPKYQPPQTAGPVLSSSNKYSVFLDKDDVDVSE